MERSCYNCGQPGHMSRDCPQGSATGGASSAPRPRGVCYDWQKGICQRGMSCRFSHANEGEQAAPMEGGMQAQGQQAQGGFQSGGFNGGNGGGGGYQARPRGICYDWQKGMCNRGAQCRFSHDDSAPQGNQNNGFQGGSNFGGQQQQSQGYGNVRPGDWQCPSCQINNFASRIQCFKCNTAKDGSGAPQQEQAAPQQQMGEGF